jgi:4-amino-4-deoxy-L-arabinose transferase-like glycosyltransferase
MLTFFKKYRYIIFIAIILFFAFFLRVYKLGEVPHGMTWDEAAIGYNGYAIFNTRRDEWINRLPISFRSFGDYKAPFAIYLNGFFTFLFGMNLFAVRLPFVLIGVSAVLAIILLVRELGSTFSWKTHQTFWLSLIAGIALTISPWHLHYSRTGFESGIALAFTVWGMYFLIKAINNKGALLPLLLSTVSFVLTLYTYHSSKLVTPLLVVITVFIFRKTVVTSFKKIIGAGLFAAIALYPLLKDSLYGKGLERASTLIFNQADTSSQIAMTFFKQFFAHLNPTFLVLGETTSFRHGDGKWGVVLPITFILIVVGLLFFVNRIKNKKKIQPYLLSIGWIIIGIIPAALGVELVPHSNRSLLALPGFLLLSLVAAKDFSIWLTSTRLNKKIIGSHGEKNMVWVSVIGMMIFIQSLFFVTYLRDYYTHFAKVSADDFKDGYLEAFEYVTQFEKDKEKIVFTSEYGQPYIFALFSRKTNPIWYQGGSLIKYEFTEVDVGDLQRKNAIIVAGRDSEFMKPEEADKVIYGSDGEVRFKIYLR